MRDPEQHERALSIARMAEGDSASLRAICHDRKIADRIVGFWAHQAVEAWLHAVLLTHGHAVVPTPDLDFLAERHESLGIALPVHRDELSLLIEHAVPILYNDLLEFDPLDRDAALALVETIEAWGRARLDAA